MRIHKPVFSKLKNEIKISARIDFSNGNKEVLWFKTTKKNYKYLSRTSDSFLTSLFILAMQLGEDVQIEGEVSKKLYKGIYEYQTIFNSWFPSFKRVKIHPELFVQEKKQEKSTKKNAASAFSGGVDSFYTFQEMLNSSKKGNKLSYVLFVHGFDIKLEDKKGFINAKESYEDMMKDLGVNVLAVSTNLKQILDKEVDWTLSHGAALIGVATLFSPLVSVFYVPSSFSRKQLHPWGSHPKTDHLLSTEKLKIVHHGTDLDRTSKIKSIARFSHAYDNLRVCSWLKGSRLNNCCRCSKCIRTMVVLEALGALKKYSTFPKPLTRKAIRSTPFAYESAYIFMKEVACFSEKNDRPDLAFDIKVALIKSYPIMISLKFLEALKIDKKITSSKFVRILYFKFIGIKSRV